MNYEQIFALRGQDYHQAMLRFPRARDREFQQVVERAQLQTGFYVGDLPAGGGYLKAYLPQGCYYQPHEPCPSFADTHLPEQEQTLASLLPLPWSEGTLDVVISLAGVHHLESKGPLLKAVHTALKPGGLFVLSDVAEGSREAHFLDTCVGRYNLTGHQGVYLNRATPSQLIDVGFELLSDERVCCDWQFESIQALGEFCQRLFGMVKTTPSQVASLAQANLGLVKAPGNQVILPWQLKTLVAKKAA